MNLAVPETPATPGDLSNWADLDRDWVAPEDFDPRAGTPGHDSTDAVRRAFASGKPVVYFPKAAYQMTGSVRVPASVRNIQFLYARFVSATPNPAAAYLDIAERSDVPLVIEDYHSSRGSGRLIDQTAWRPLVMRHVGTMSVTYRNHVASTPPVPLYLASVNGFGRDARAFANTTSFIRALNTEAKTMPDFVIPDGAKMWVLGFKTEGTVPAFQVERGGTLEVLGGIVNMFGSSLWTAEPIAHGDCPDPSRKVACFGVLQNFGGQVSASLVTSRTGRVMPGQSDPVPIAIQDGAPDNAGAIPRSEVPARRPVSAQFRDFSIPLYVSFGAKGGAQ